MRKQHIYITYKRIRHTYFFYYMGRLIRLYNTFYQYKHKTDLLSKKTYRTLHKV